MKKEYALKAVILLAIFFSEVSTWAVEGENCLSCHERKSPMVVEQWRGSAHGREDVACLSCHDPEITKTIISDRCPEKVAVVVSPNVCFNCHEKEVTEQEGTKIIITIQAMLPAYPD